MTQSFPRQQRGGTVLGFILGLVLGLGIAVAVALYITNAPVPFVNKVRPASENVNPSAGGQLPDPNKPLQAPMPARPGATGAVTVDPATDPKAAPPQDGDERSVAHTRGRPPRALPHQELDLLNRQEFDDSAVLLVDAVRFGEGVA